MEHYIVYDTVTGRELWRGGAQPGTLAAIPLPEGAAIVAVPQAVISSPELDLTALKVAAAARIDEEAEQVRLRFLTPGAGQGMTYLRKEAEARAYLKDPKAPTPFLAAEAAACDITVDALAAEVVAQADAWVPVGAAIEGLRMAAKRKSASGETVGAIVSAAAVAWPAP
ncbi:hypothetical protein [Sphingomonas sp. BK580]|uniref:hypothetical protein n=1 Tax=Sphingomonas sp. BK580 TaxID=2586972 RepID=UPI00161799AB|nr:hypothetical protein [Sphingomonas sp. BK580]MBB3692996.1 hypothetical protein [Sphingomonas sp. BK580]